MQMQISSMAQKKNYRSVLPRKKQKEHGEKSKYDRA